jgi:hypothetical protein
MRIQQSTGITQSTLNGNGHLYGVHSIMMEKSTKNDEGGGAHPPSLTISTITYKVVVSAPAERAVAHPLFPLNTYTYSVGPPLSSLSESQSTYI